jgi:hypothetical protein
MNPFKNDKKAKFLASIPLCSLESETDLLTSKCKFNFAYFEKQTAEQSFEEWPDEKLHKLLAKLRDYSQQSLTHWMLLPIGKSGTVLSIYGAFPTKSAFTHPKHVPHQALWGRFRLEWADRLIGFVIPNSYHDKAHPVTGERYDCNTFYVVFLDADHKFYQSGKESK